MKWCDMTRRKSNEKRKRTDKISSSKITGSKYHGLENQGATCYLNSVLQVLFMTKDFRAAVSSSANSDPKCIDLHLSSLFNTLQNKTAKTQVITDHLKIRKVSEQDDAAECFEKILSCSSQQALQIFQGQLTHRNTCSKCHTITHDDQPFWSLPLPLVDSDKDYYLMDGIKSFFEESNISGESQMYCNQCKAKADATIKADIKHPPQVLTLLIKRFKFDYNNMKYVKMSNKVEIPFILQIPHNEDQSQTYELYAYVQHSGDLKHGHYTVNIKPHDDEKWYNFNDTTVTSIPQVDYKKRSQNAYLLFYRKSSATDTLSQDISEVSTSKDPKNDNEDKNKQPEQDVKPGKRKMDKETDAADSQKTDSSRKGKRKKTSKGGKDSKTLTDDNGSTSMSQKSREAVENQQSKQNHDQQSKQNHNLKNKKGICDKVICNPPACSSEEQNRDKEECKRGDDQKLRGEQSLSRCSDSKVDQDIVKLDHVCQVVSEVSEALKHHTQDKHEPRKQNLKIGERKEDEEPEAANSQKTDKRNSKTKEKKGFRTEKDNKTLTNVNSTSMNHKSRKHPSNIQCKNRTVKVQDDGRLQERNSQNPSPDNSHSRQTSSQINQKYNHQVSDRRDRTDAEYQRSKQNHHLEGKKDICDKSICNSPACSIEEQNKEEEECKKGDDQTLSREQSESHCNEDSGKLADVSQDISNVSTFEIFNLNISKQLKESNEKKLVNVRDDQDRETCVEIQEDKQKMMCRRLFEKFEKISLCNDQTQKRGEDGVSKNTFINNEEHKQATSNSVNIKNEYCDESEGNQEFGKSEKFCQNKLREDQGQEVNTQVIKERKEDLEVKCDPVTDNMDTLSGCLKNLSQRDSSESKESGNKYTNGKVENNTEMKSLTESSAENSENLLLGTQTEVDSDKSHESGRKGRKNKKGQNKTFIYIGLPSPRMKNTNQSS